MSGREHCHLNAVRVLVGRKVRTNPGHTAAEPVIALMCLGIQSWVFSAICHQKESGKTLVPKSAKQSSQICETLVPKSAKVLLSREDVF